MCYYYFMEKDMPIFSKKHNPYPMAFLVLALALIPFPFKNLIISSGYFTHTDVFYVAFLSTVLCYEALVFGLAVFGWSRLLIKRRSKTHVLHVFFASFLYVLALWQTFVFTGWFGSNVPHTLM